MSMRKLISTLFLAGSVLVPALAFASAPTHRPLCILDEYQVTSVRPYRTEEHIGRATITKTRGAEVYVQAQPGLTAEWLSLQLSRHIATMQATDMNACALDVSNVRIEVASAGGGFWVKLITNDGNGAKEVLRRARLLLDA